MINMIIKSNYLVLLYLIFSSALWAQKVSVDYTDTHQRINMIGTDMERSAHFVQQAANPQDVINWTFVDIPYRAVRVSYDKKQELTEGVKNYAFYSDAIKTMQMALQANPDLEFYATMKSDYNGYGGANNLPDWICDYKPTTFFYVDKYVAFLADYLQLMNDNGVPITYMTVSKEWSSVITADRTIAIIEGLLVELPARNVPIPRFTDPSAWSVKQAKNFVNSVISKGKQELFYAYSTHNYGNTWEANYDDFVLACKNAGSYSWNDESGYGSGGRTNGEEPETIDAILGAYDRRAFYYKQGLEGELFFEIFSRGIASETRAIYFTNGGTAKRMRSYYVGKLFAQNIYMRNYTTSSIVGMDAEVSTMAFSDNDEIALWIINSSDNAYSSVELEFDNVSIASDVLHFSFTNATNIQGDMTQLEAKNGKYSMSVAPHSVNYIEVRINEQSDDTDVIELLSEAIDFGSLGTDVLDETERLLYVKVDHPSSDVSVSIKGNNASAFSIKQNAVMPKAPLVWYVPVVFSFNPSTVGFYEATVEVKSGGETRSLPIRGEAFLSETVTMPFVDDFPTLDVSSTLDNTVINAYSKYKGWTVNGGLSTTATRLKIKSTANPEACIMTPEIVLDGPFELKFNARMLQNSKSGDGKTTQENDLVRNIFAIIDNDTIYDHHKAGNSALFQNYNQWTSTFFFTGKAKLKFMAKVGSTGVWSGVSDGLIFGPNTDAIRVQATTLPAINVAYGHRLDYGEVLANSINDIRFTIQGQNLSEGLALTADEGSNVLLSQYEVPLSGTTVNQQVIFRINTMGLEPGEYTSKVTLKGEDKQIKTRTITLHYTVVDALALMDVESKEHSVRALDGSVKVKSSQPNSLVKIYGMTGQLLVSEVINQEVGFDLPQGVYMVDVAGRTVKVLVR